MLGKPSRRTRKRLDEHGVRASAVVLEIAKHGVTMESGSEDRITSVEEMLKAKLRVEPTGQPAFEVEKRFRFSQYDTPTAGQRVDVVFDSDDHDTIELARFAAEQPLGSFSAAASAGGGMDLGNLLASVQQARAESGGDPQALAAALGASLGGQTPVVVTGGAGSPEGIGEDPVDQLSKLADLRDRGALTDEEFAAQKARILGQP